MHNLAAIPVFLGLPAANWFVRQITTFLRGGDGSWRRDDETHHNVLVDTAHLPALLAAEGVRATVAPHSEPNSCPPDSAS